MIVPTANYPTSRDYRQLWELAHTAAIVCIVDMDHGKPDTCRDIARTVHSPEWSPELVQVGTRGIGHVWAESLEAFIAGCEQCNLEWLVPPAALPAPPASNFDPRRIALATTSEQIPPGLYSEHELRTEQDAQADEYNQWESLDSSEQLAWAQDRAIAADRNGRPAAPPAPEVGEVVAYLQDHGTWLIQSGYANASIDTRDLGIRVFRAATLLRQLSAITTKDLKND